MQALVSRILCIPYFLSWKVRIWLPESVSILRRITGPIRGFRGDEALYSLCRVHKVPALYRAASTLGSH